MKRRHLIVALPSAVTGGSWFYVICLLAGQRLPWWYQAAWPVLLSALSWLLWWPLQKLEQARDRARDREQTIQLQGAAIAQMHEFIVEVIAGEHDS